ncbi:MAG: toprim domain-containing protein [Mycoplasmatales bacterium]
MNDQIPQIDKVLQQVNVVNEKKTYYLCECPACHKPEAFLYKNNPSFLKCNRENECGVVTPIKGITINTENAKQYTNVDEKRRMLKTTLELFFNENADMDEYIKQEIEFRGITNKEFKDDVIFLDKYKHYVAPDKQEEFLPFLKELFEKSISDFEKRNILILCRNKTGSIERVFLRMENPVENEPKEKQIVLVDGGQDFLMSKPVSGIKSDTKIFITEGVFDALSIKKVLPESFVIGLSGATKQRQVIERLKEMNTQNPIYVCFDNDEAGRKNSVILNNKIKDLGLNSEILTLARGEYKDVNDLLEANLLDMRINEVLGINKAIEQTDEAIHPKSPIIPNLEKTTQVPGKKIPPIINKNPEKETKLNVSEIQNFDFIRDKSISIEEKTKVVFEKIELEIDSILSNETKLKKFFESRFLNDKYSPRNQILLMSQAPLGTYFRTYKEFEDMGLYVQKGQKGLSIFVPEKITLVKNKESGELIPFKEVHKYSENEVEKIDKIKYKIVNGVFDIDQTNATNTQKMELLKIKNNLPEEQFYQLEKAIDEVIEREIEVGKARLSKGIVGSYYRQTNPNDTSSHSIVIDEKLSNANRISVTLHEYGHSQMHNLSKMREGKHTHHIKEFQAECFAYISASALGLGEQVKFNNLEYLNYHKQELLNYSINFSEILLEPIKQSKIFLDKVKQSAMEQSLQIDTIEIKPKTVEQTKESDKGKYHQVEKAMDLIHDNTEIERWK